MKWLKTWYIVFYTCRRHYKWHWGAVEGWRCSVRVERRKEGCWAVKDSKNKKIKIKKRKKKEKSGQVLKGRWKCVRVMLKFWVGKSVSRHDDDTHQHVHVQRGRHIKAHTHWLISHEDIMCILYIWTVFMFIFMKNFTFWRPPGVSRRTECMLKRSSACLVL